MRRLLTILSIFTQCALATTYHVGPGGADVGKDGKSYANRWLTITKANGSASGGDTVVIYQGDYANQYIAPPSGTAGDWTCYMANGNDTVGITGNGMAYMCSPKYVSIVGDFRFTTSEHAINILHAFDNVHIEGVTVRAPNNGAYCVAIDGDTTNLYNQIYGGHRVTLKDCWFYGYWHPGRWEQLNTDLILYFQGDYLHVEGCYFKYAGHYAINTFYNRVGVIRNNFFDGPSHGHIGLNGDTRSFLIEGNISRTLAMDSVRAGTFFQAEAESCIIRLNVFMDDSLIASVPESPSESAINNAGSITAYDANVRYNARDNRMYHNTLSGRYDRGSPTWADTTLSLWGEIRGSTATGSVDRNRYLNNVFWKSRIDYLLSLSNPSKTSPGDWTHFWNGNLLYLPGDTSVVQYEGTWGEIGVYGLGALKYNYPAQWGSGNIYANPLFTDSTTYGFVPSASSPLISAAVPLTVAVGGSAGSQNLSILDGLVLSDGFGIIAPDSIYIEGAAPTPHVGTTAINRLTGAVTLSSSRSWSNGAGIYLWKGGRKVDEIGSTQLGEGSTEPDPLSITTTSPLNSGTVGISYSRAISATGGTAPYAFTVISGSVPGGLGLSLAGILSGTPTTAGTSNFTVRVTDDAEYTADKAFSVTINDAPAGGDTTLAAVWATNILTLVKWNRTNHPMKTSTSNDIWVNGDTVKVFGGRNETVSWIQVLEAGAVSVPGVSVHLEWLSNGVTTLQNQTTSCTTLARYIDLYRAHYHWIAESERASTYPAWDAQAGGNGWDGSKPMPDSTWTGYIPYGLIPVEAPHGFYGHNNRGPEEYVGQGGNPFTVSAYHNELIYVDVFIPKWLPAGTYYGSFVIKRNGVQVRSVPVKLSVYSFTLSDDTHLRNYHFVGQQVFKNVMGVGRYDNVSGGDGAYWELVKRWKQMFKKHRMDLQVSYQHVDTFKTQYGGYLTGWKYDSTQGYIGPGQGKGDQVYSIGNYIMGVDTSRYWSNISDIGPWSDNESGWQGMADTWNGWFKDSAANATRWIYMMDEPHRRADPNPYLDSLAWVIIGELQQRADWVRTSPGDGWDLDIASTQWMDPVQTQYVTASGDTGAISFYLCTGLPHPWWGYHVGTNEPGSWTTQEVRNYVKRDRVKLKVGSYNGYRGGLANAQHLDTPLSDGAILPWLQYDYDADVAYMWESAMWAYGGLEGYGAPYNYCPMDQWQIFATDYVVWGEGTWVLTGKDIFTPGESRGVNMPIASTRMKAYRYGLQLVEYRWLAEQTSIWNTNWDRDSINYYAAFDDFRYSQHQPDQYPSYSEDGVDYEHLRMAMANALGSVGENPPVSPPNWKTFLIKRRMR